AVNAPRAAHAPAGLEGARLVRPRTVREACAGLADGGHKNEPTMLLLGGTAFVVDRHLMPVDRAKPVALVVDLTGVEGFHAIEAFEEDGEWRLPFAGGVTHL